ncbi:extracellular solute-binding protein [Paenibacillus sp. SAFN-117]|uniref:extracellular solute-binding protein n=1 Tax=Paenibacillus sp. SAFN-117 TaxID=3436860 RepID=UPI003F7F7A64
MSTGRRSKSHLSIAVLLVFVLILSACSGGKAESVKEETPNQGNSQENASEKRDVGGLKLPIADKKLELSLWAPSGGNFRGKDFNEKLSFQKMEENTNIHIQFQHSTEASAEAFSLLMSSGQLPDMIFNEAWDREAGKYGQKGALLPLEDLIDKHAPNIKRILDENPEIRGQITSPDGHIFYLPNLVLDSENLTQMFPQVRKDWIDKLGLKMPETIDDWYEMLKAFREQDPNGNGKQDEIPFVTVNLNNVMMTFAPAFGVEFGFFVEDGKVKYGPHDPRFKEVVEFLNKLYNEKLLDPNYLVDTTFQTLTEKVTTDLAGAWFGWSGSYMGNFTTLMEGKHPTFEIAPALPPKGPRGDQRHVSFRWPAAGVGLAVSSQTKHPEEVIRWLDYQYSEEGVLLNNFGVEGKSYDLVNGEPVYKKEVTHPEDGLTNTQALLNHTIGGGTWATIADPRYAEQIRIANGQTENPLELYGKYIDFDAKLPPVQFTPQENDVIVPMMADIDTYVNETINGIIMGRIPVDSYDNVISQLEKMGITKVLEQYQSAYDRFRGK